MPQSGPEQQPVQNDEVITELARLKKSLDPEKSDEDCKRWAKEAYPDIKTRAYYYSQLNPSSSDIANWDAARRDILKGITANELKEIEIQIRSMVQHENDLLNHRIQWFLIINGFLLTATASLKTKPSDDTFVMLIILAVVGLLVCISFSFSLGIGRRGVGRLANMWQHYRDLFYRSEAPTGCHQIGVLGWRANEWASRAAPWYALPIIFAAVWGVLIYANALAKPIAEEKPPMIQVVQPSGKTTKISIDPSLSPSIVIQLSNGGAEIKSPIGATKEKK